MIKTKRHHSKEAFAQRGEKIYESSVLKKLKRSDDGKFVAIDIDTSQYEIDADELAACDRLRARAPGAQIWIVRVGSRFVQRFGACRRRSA